MLKKIAFRTVELKCEGDVKTRDEDGNPPRENTIQDNETESDQSDKNINKSCDNIGDEKKRKGEGDDDTVETKRKRISKCDVSLVVSREMNGWTLRLVYLIFNVLFIRKVYRFLKFNVMYCRPILFSLLEYR